MTIDGIECASCEIESGDDSDFCALYDCENTVLGRKGNLCAVDLGEETEEYFVYKHLPCPGGCSLCGEDKVMTKQDATFTQDGTMKGCFDAQFEALVGPKGESECTELQSLVETACGCEDTSVRPALPPSPPTLPPSGVATTSLSSVIRTAGTVAAVATTLATLSHLW